MRHIMLDIETVSTAPSAVVWAVGLQEFGFTLAGDGTLIPSLGNVGKLLFLDPEEQGIFVTEDWADWNESTEAWTLQSGDAANFSVWLAHYENEEEHVPGSMEFVTVKQLHTIIKDMIGPNPKDVVIWCKGKDFDITILKRQFEMAMWNGETDMEKEPWYYRNTGCIRTYEIEANMWGLDLDAIRNRQTTISHNALMDAQGQVFYLTDLLNTVRGAG